jgi:hypothetical protein
MEIKEMDEEILPAGYDELIEYLAERVSPEDILAIKASKTEAARAEELVERQKARTITPEERLELKLMVHLDSLVSVMKAKAMKKLNKL